MKTETIMINQKKGVSLTSYLLDASDELANAKIRPAVLICPGGGYTMCSDREAEPVAMAYLAEGYHAFVLRYSVGEGSEWPDPLRDAEAALELIHTNSVIWGVDREKIAAAGFSAGGHLVAALSTMGRVRPNAMILGYPCILEEIGAILNNPVPGLEDKVDRETPPAFLFTTRDDSLVPARNTIRFMAALDEANIPFEAHIFHSGAHGLSLARNHTSAGFAGNVNSHVAQWFGMSVEWLKQIFGEFESNEEFNEIGVNDETTEYGVDNSLKALWRNEECRNIVIAYIPMLQEEAAFSQAKNVSLRTMSKYAKDMLTVEMLVRIDDELKGIKKE